MSRTAYFPVIFLLAVSVLASGGSANANVYYVDAIEGKDINEGLAPDGAWRTIDRVNEARLLPGDSVLFRAGQIWNKGIVATHSGEENNFIVYGMYGEGDRPLLDMRYREQSGFRTDRSYLRIENIDFSNARNNALQFTGSNHVKIENVGVIFATKEPGTISTSEIGIIGNNGIAFLDGGGSIHISNVTISYAPNNGMLFRGHRQHNIGDVTVSNSYIHHSLLNDGITVHEDCCGGVAGSNFRFEGNKVEYCWEQGYDITSGSFVSLVGNESRENAEGGIMIGHSATDVSVIRHESADEPVKNKAAAVVVSGDRVLVQDSSFAGRGHHLIGIVGLDSRPIDGVAIIANVFTWNGGSSIMDVTGPIDNLRVEGNIFRSLSGNYVAEGHKQRIIRFRNPERPPDYKTFVFGNNHYEGKPVFQKTEPDGYQKSFDLKTFRTLYNQEKQ